MHAAHKVGEGLPAGVAQELGVHAQVSESMNGAIAAALCDDLVEATLRASVSTHRQGVFTIIAFMEYKK